MADLGNARGYDVRQRLSWIPEYRVWHTVLLVVLTGIAGWYAVYLAIVWLLETLGP